MDPYSGTARLVIYALIVLAIVGAIARWRYAEAALTDARAKNEALVESAALQQRNALLAAVVVTKWRESDEKRWASAAKAKEAVRDAKTTVPPECRGALRPLGRALDGLRELRRESGGAAPAGSRVLARS